MRINNHIIYSANSLVCTYLLMQIVRSGLRLDLQTRIALLSAEWISREAVLGILHGGSVHVQAIATMINIQLHLAMIIILY